MGPTMSTFTLGCSDPEEEQNTTQAPGESVEIRTVSRSESGLSLSSTPSTPDSPAAVFVSPESITLIPSPASAVLNANPTTEASDILPSTVPVTPSSSPSIKVESDSLELTLDKKIPDLYEEDSNSLESSTPSSEKPSSISSSPEIHSNSPAAIVESYPPDISSSSVESEALVVLSASTKSIESLTESPPSIVVSCKDSATSTVSSSAVTTFCESGTPTSKSLSISLLCDSPLSTKTKSVDSMAEVSAAQDMENGVLEDQNSSNPMEEVDDVDIQAPKPLVAPSNTPINGDSGQNSPTMERSSSSEDGQKEKGKDSKTTVTPDEKPEEKVKPNAAPANTNANPVKESPRNGARENKKDKSASGKSKKKEDKGIEYILRALNSLQTPEEKLAALCKRYADMHEEHRVLQTSFKTQQRSMTVLMREKDQIQSDHAKAVIAKSKLESLCRELQKQNKLIKDESIQRAKEDDEKRREISGKFQTTIAEIQTQMNNNNERNTKLQKENMELASQLKKFVEQYENREQKMKQHRDLEQQVAEARLTQARALLKEEQEKNGKEKELLLMKAAESGKKASLLEAQVEMFKKRYDEFESLHARSNETFQKYKTEMDKMTKRIKRLEKDGMAWKSKWERTNKSLIESIEARSNSEKETAMYVQKTKKLESLCRALQAELHKDKKAPTPSADTVSNNTSPVDDVPPNSPESSSASGQVSPDAAAVQSDNPETPPTDKESDGQPPDTATTDQTSSQETESSNLQSGSPETQQQQSDDTESEVLSKPSSAINSAPVAEACTS